MASGDLAKKRCVPCEGGVPKIVGAEAQRLLGQLEGWRLHEDHHLWKVFVFPDFAKALAFVNAVGAIAEAEGHHPDVKLSWGRVELELHTHAIDGLSENDFILAAKVDRL